jgi:hypothetical protein
MLRDLDPPMDDTTCLRLGRLIDAIETGPPPSLDDLERGVHLQIVSDNRTDHRRPDHRRTLLAAGIAAALVLIVGTALVLRGGDDGEDDLGNAPESVPRLALDPATSSLDLPPAAATDLPLAPGDVDEGSASVVLYGDPAADDPFARGDLAVIVVTDETVGMMGDEVQVRGHDGMAGGPDATNDLGLVAASTDPGAADEGFAWISWFETDSVEVTLASRSVAADDLATVAEALTIDGTAVTLGTLPPGVAGTEIGRLEGLQFGGVGYAPDTAAGHSVFYGSIEGATLMVSTYIADPDQLVVARWMADARQPAEVRGHPAWSSRTTSWNDQPTQILLWQESDDVVGVAQGSGLPEGELQQIADGLVSPTDAEWDAMPGSILESDFLGEDG